MRMLKTSSAEARRVFKEVRAVDDEAHAFISFMHRNFLAEEENCYPIKDWKEVATRLGIDITDLSREQIIGKVREFSEYMAAFALRRLTE